MPLSHISEVTLIMKRKSCTSSWWTKFGNIHSILNEFCLNLFVITSNSGFTLFPHQQPDTIVNVKLHYMYKRTLFMQRNFNSAHQPDKILFSSLNLIVICCLYSSVLNFVSRLLVLWVLLTSTLRTLINNPF